MNQQIRLSIHKPNKQIINSSHNNHIVVSGELGFTGLSLAHVAKALVVGQEGRQCQAISQLISKMGVARTQYLDVDDAYTAVSHCLQAATSTCQQSLVRL